MTKRLFVSITIPKKIGDEIARVRQISLKGKINWVDPQYYHLTLAFLGETDETAIPSIVESLHGVVLLSQPFFLILNDIVFTPRATKQPQMIWAMFRDSDRFIRFTESVRHVLCEWMPRDEHARIIPHVTLARIKELQGGLPDLPLIDPLDFEVRQIELVESELRPDGPHYSTLQSFDL